MKILSIISRFVVATSALLLGANAAQAQPPKGWSANDLIAIERCAGFILMGPQYNGIKIRGEGFNCKPVGNITTKGGGVIEVSGQLSHQLSYRPDDQQDFVIRIGPDGTVREIKIVHDAGGVEGSLAFFADEFDEKGIVVKKEWQTLSGPALARAVAKAYPINTSRWTGIAIITMAAAEFGRSVANHDNAPAYFFDRPGKDLASIKLEDGKHVGDFNINSRFPRTYFDACQSACNKRNDCHAWSVVRQPKPICYVKGPGTQAAMDRDAISGIKPNMEVIGNGVGRDFTVMKPPG